MPDAPCLCLFRKNQRRFLLHEAIQTNEAIFSFTGRPTNPKPKERYSKAQHIRNWNSLTGLPLLGQITDGLKIGRTAMRLCGIDAPEMGTKAGRDAKRALTRLAAGKRVRYVPVRSGTPCDGRSKRKSHNRTVAQCFVGDVDLAAEMVRQGHADDWQRFSGGHYRQAFWWEFWRFGED